MGRLSAIAAVLGCYPVLVVAALWPSPVVFGAVAAASYATEYAAPRHARPFLGLLAKVHVDATFRFVIREMAALLLVARTTGPGSPWFVAMALGLFALHGLRAVQTWVALRLRHTLSVMPVTTRNLDVSALRIPRLPPEFLIDFRGVRFLYLDLPAVLGASAGALAGAMGTGVSLLLGAAGALAVLPFVRRTAPLADRAHILEVVDGQVRAYRPEVILYFSGAPQAAYQARMWLPVLERIDRRAVVVLRERGMARHLEETTLPVLCIPSSADLMGFHSLSDAKLCLYVANVGKNIHMLRIPGLRSAFIGHGDSDKQASFNPFSKVYDEVWVAGPAGRDRYRRAGVGVRDEDVHEVGRPQLEGITADAPMLPPVPSTSAASVARAPYRTVLYAPTWEGWTDDLFHTSLITMGPRIVRALLDHEPPVRLIYKAHPLTGHRDRSAARAHRQIVAMIEAATLARSKLRHPSHTGHALPAGHLVVSGPRPHLYDCFNQADLLITDISCLVSDFLASGKPYAVTNVADLPERIFHERYPSTEAGVLLGEDLAGLAGLLDGADTLAAARDKLRTYLLGPEFPDGMARFSAAVERVCAGS